MSNEHGIHPLRVAAPRTIDSIYPWQVGATTVWLLLADVQMPDGRLPIVYEGKSAQN